MVLEEQISELRAKFFAIRETRPASHIYCLLDNDCPVSPDHPLHAGQLEKREVKRERALVGEGASTLPPEWQPALLQLYRAGERGYVDEELIALSVTCATERCQSINGAYVAAWIASDLGPTDLAAHLHRSGEIFDSHQSQRRYLPFFQPHRMALLADDPESKSFLHVYLAPIHSWSFVDVAGTLRTIIPERPEAPTPSIGRVPLSQCRKQSRVAMARRVVLGIQKAGIKISDHTESAIDSHLVEADRQGVRHAEDLVFFALNSLSLSSRWHEHPRARQLIQQCRDDDAALAGLFSELSDEALAEIGDYEPSDTRSS